MRFKDYILQEKKSDTGVPVRIFDKTIQKGYTEIDLPDNKEIKVHPKTGVPYLRAKPCNPGEEFYFCYWE
ncbi:MAG: hypothetical protein CM15mV42_1250 [uncultured marine virus]|nr:MAG: hypothetical protein CM15mV42_1250 [uncultured marine virus]